MVMEGDGGRWRAMVVLMLVVLDRTGQDKYLCCSNFIITSAGREDGEPKITETRIFKSIGGTLLVLLV